MALLMMLAIPAMAQEFSGTVEVDCFGDPETVTVTNTGTTPFIVDSVTSLDDPRDNEPFDVSVELEGGVSVLFEAGAAASQGVLTNQFIFDNDADDEGVEVVINTEGQSATAVATCDEGSATFGGAPSPGPIVEPKVPDNQQDGGKDMVTKTFELTLNGTVPADQAFYVVFTPEGGGETDAIIFCGQVPGLEPEAECEGDGTVYRGTAEFAAGTALQSNWNRIDEDTAANEPFHMTTETLNTAFTNTAWYTFGTGAGDDQQDDTQDDVQDDQQGEMPGEMPDTGMGGLATGATIPAGNAVAGLAMFIGAGYAVVQRR